MVKNKNYSCHKKIYKYIFYDILTNYNTNIERGWQIQNTPNKKMVSYSRNPDYESYYDKGQ